MRTEKSRRGLVMVKCHLLYKNDLMKVKPQKIFSLKSPINLYKLNKVFMPLL
ncbi:h-NS histone family protein [Escherichia coli]|nr:h-NS histone family protein [Escherichia coli]OJP56550.1 h-NS histone family protein [Escherichia coli]